MVSNSILLEAAVLLWTAVYTHL